MVLEAKEWKKCTRRCKNLKSGGIHVYVDSQALFNAGISNTGKLEVKIYGLDGQKVLLQFREVKDGSNN